MATGLLESDRCKSGVEMAAGNVGLVQLVTAACAEEKPRLAVADELNQQLRHVVREVYFTLPAFRLEVIVDFAVPCLLINDDAGTAVENLLDAYTQRLTNSETTRTQRMKSIRIFGLMVGELARWFITSTVKH